MPLQHAFASMSTEITLGLAEPCDTDAARAAFAAVEALFARYEATLSRFRADSELAALNRASGRAFICSALLFDTVRRALDAAAATDGVFEPCVLEALLAAGYDKTFAVVALTEPCDAPRPVAPPAGRWRSVRLDREQRSVMLPPGTRLDLGGIGKGLAADAALALLRPLGGCFVDAGGDVVVSGNAEDGSWRAGVQNPWQPRSDLAVVELHDEALATSSIVRRRWRRGGIKQHHLIDPRTGRPAMTDLVAASVRATSTARADVLAKSAVILGGKRGVALIEEEGAAALLVRGDSTLIASSRWQAL